MSQADIKAITPLFSNLLDNAKDLCAIAVETSDENEIAKRVEDLDRSYIALRTGWVKYRKKTRADRACPRSEWFKGEE
ncbi:MAG: hypothetical protein ACRDBG_07790 [Waterburya sp.]